MFLFELVHVSKILDRKSLRKKKIRHRKHDITIPEEVIAWKARYRTNQGFLPRWREKHNLNVNFAASGLQEASSSPLRLPSFLITTSFDQLSKEGLLIVYFSLTLSRFFREFQGFEFRKIYTWNVKEILRIELSRIVKNSRNDKSDRFGSS